MWKDPSSGEFDPETGDDALPRDDGRRIGTDSGFTCEPKKNVACGRLPGIPASAAPVHECVGVSHQLIQVGTERIHILDIRQAGICIRRRLRGRFPLHRGCIRDLPAEDSQQATYRSSKFDTLVICFRRDNVS